MTRSAAVTWGTSGDEVRVEYVKSRGVLRFRTGRGGGTRVEVAVEEFCRGLGIDVAQLAPTRNYLLFAGVGDHPGAPLRHLVSTFATEDKARAAFRSLRLAHVGPADWAELASVEPSGGLRRLCWFGEAWGPGGRARSDVLIGNREVGPVRPDRSRRLGSRARRRKSAAAERGVVATG